MKLQTIKTEKGYVAISGEKINIDDWYVCWDELYNPAKYSIYNLVSTANGKNPKKIVATDSSFKLEGIPQFKTENDWEDALQKTPLFYIPEKMAFVKGWNAAKSEGCFTEEDVKNAFQAGWLCNDTSDCAEEEIKYISSLKTLKQLVAIDVLSGIKTTVYPGTDKPSVTETHYSLRKSEQYSDGLLTVKEYFYE